MSDNERQPGDSGDGGENGGENSGEDKAVAPRETAEDSEEQSEGEFDENGADADEIIAELKDQLLRALAETENVRRRARKDVTDANRYGVANFARDMLSVSDNMARALDSIPDEAREDSEIVKALVEGVEMTAREMASALQRHGIEQVNPLGEKFDYNLHQAMFEAPASGQPDGTIIEVVQAGYVIGERLLRPAMVGVAKGAGGASGAPADDGGGENGGGEEAANLGAKLDTSA
ncbi:MAG: nucleotide exchange factor GrpE [Alphaproteobacteria bacterium]|jgi:molecular chaperone GrpE|nr:nucleotide exchange factor GrpE [Alphaproteobacteria bacterium]